LNPTLQALVLADHIYTDAQTGKRVVAGTFRRLLTEKLGGQGPTTYAYISLTSIRDEVCLALRYVDLDDNSVLLETEFKVVCDDPLATVEMSVQVPPLPTPHEGVFAFELLCNDVQLGSLRIRVSEIPKSEGEHNDDTTT